jgi:hypothetical protein
VCDPHDPHPGSIHLYLAETFSGFVGDRFLRRKDF